VDWAPDNSILVSANVIEKVVRIYNAKTFELLKKFNNSGQEPRSVKVSKNSLYVAIGYRNSDLVVLHATSPYGVYFQVATGQSRIAEVDFSFDNTGVMSCGDDQGYQIYSLSTQAKIVDIRLTPNPGNAVACRFSSLGYIGYSDNNRRVRIRDTAGIEVFQNSSWGDDTM
jgi:WD40 repeat protein